MAWGLLASLRPYPGVQYVPFSNDEILQIQRMLLEILCVILWSKFSRASYVTQVSRGADMSLTFPISYFPICSTTKRIFLGWVKEVRTTKS
jgi:hypothetical protein